jgi:hypothetical protein
MYPNVTFDLPLVARVGKIADVMGAFLSEQIESLELKIRSEQPNLPENFVTQLLDLLVSKSGTKQPLPRKNISIDGVDASTIDFCLRKLETSRILREEDNVWELAHDALAAWIDKNRSDDQRRFREVREILTNSFDAHQKQLGDFLNQKQVDFVYDFLPKLGLSAEMLAFVEQSQQTINAKHQEEKDQQQRELRLARDAANAEKARAELQTKAANKQMRYRNMIGAVAVIAFGGFIWAMFAQIEANKQRAIAVHQQKIAQTALDSAQASYKVAQTEKTKANTERDKAISLKAELSGQICKSFYQRGIILMGEKEFENAIDELQKSLEFCPNDAGIQSIIAECRTKKSKEKAFKSLIERGDALLAKGTTSLPAAIALYESAQKMGFDNAAATLKISEANNRRARAADMLKERGLRYLEYGECFLAEKYLLLSLKLVEDASLEAKIAKAKACQQ